uniref:Uncharacterized protein n=1 Tax=uncultured bacterium A1Q1_fos_291 TaxID=1256570 RepID=L7W0P8_9BACT|nr:hypothetical protein [uncultured bacterium A1Q1_fos_291]
MASVPKIQKMAIHASSDHIQTKQIEQSEGKSAKSHGFI